MDEIVDVNTLFGPLPAASTDLTMEALLELMQKHQVGVACTLSTLGLLLDPSVGNAVTRAACTEYEPLLPVATLNPTMFFGDERPLQKFREEGFRFVRFFPQLQDWSLDFLPFHALLEALSALKMPIMVDINAPGQITMLGRSIENFGAPVMLSGVATETLAEAVAALRRYSSLHLETSQLLAPGNIKMLVDTVGIDRLLFGTGAPAQPVASALNTLQYAGLTGDAMHQILSSNARRLLSITGQE